ncbi:MAG: hypothetical protein ACXVBB_09080 [Isosphaeraceae bacterium]
MMAGLINAVRSLQYTTVLAHRDPKKPAPEPPSPYPIPDEERKAAKPGSFAFIAAQHISQMKKQKEGT